MLTSKDLEFVKFREIYKLHENFRFFPIDCSDLNFYHFGILGARREWSHAEFRIAAQRLLSLEDLPANRRDSKLAQLIAERCYDKRAGANPIDFWLNWVELLWSPVKLSKKLALTPASEVSDCLGDLVTLLHAIPQSPIVGVMKHVCNSAARFEKAPVTLGPEVDWTTMESTLSMLRPLEYLFDIGHPSARQATIQLYYDSIGLLRGGTLDFSGQPISQPACDALPNLLEDLGIHEMTTVFRGQNQGESLSSRLAACLHHGLPVHSAVAWNVANSTYQIWGLPWKPRSTNPESVMARAESLKGVPDDAARWLRGEVQAVVEGGDGVIATISGPGRCTALPMWDFAGASKHPLDPKLCATFVLIDRQQALQLLLPWQGALPQDRELTRRLGAVIDRVRLLATEMSISGRFPGGAVTLPPRWVYSPETGSGLKQCVEQLRRSWAGDQTCLERPFLLFCGTPGTGKSTLAAEFAHEIVGDPSPIIRDSGEMKSVEHGRTEKNLTEVFDQLLVQGPRALILNEIEQFTRQEGGDAIHGNITASFKTQMDRLVAYRRRNRNARLLVLGTTNHFDLIEDGVVSRAQVVKFLWGQEECMRLLDILTRQKWDEEARVELQRLASLLRFDPRKIEELVSRAENNAKRDRVDRFDSRFVVRRSHVIAGVDGTPLRSDVNGSQSLVGGGGFDTGRIQELLASLLDEARRSGAGTDERLTLADKNQLSLLRRLFPDWAQRLNDIKRANGKGPVLYD